MDTKKKCIIVVDDEPAIRKLIGDIVVRFLNHDVIVSENGEEALLKLQQQDKVDLIISDLDMPFMDGRQLVRQLKARENFKSIPVLLMSGHSMEEAVKLCEDGFANESIGKPFGIADFKQLVTELLI